MKKTRHVLLVGDNALKFAKEQGFAETDLGTDETRKSVARVERKQASRRFPHPNSARPA